MDQLYIMEYLINASVLTGCLTLLFGLSLIMSFNNKYFSAKMTTVIKILILSGIILTGILSAVTVYLSSLMELVII